MIEQPSPEELRWLAVLLAYPEFVERLNRVKGRLMAEWRPGVYASIVGKGLRRRRYAWSISIGGVTRYSEDVYRTEDDAILWLLDALVE